MKFKSRVDQISHKLPMTRHRCNLKVWALAQSLGDGHRSLVTPEKVLSEYNEDLIFLFPHQLQAFCLKFYSIFLTHVPLVLRLRVRTVLSKSTN